MIMHSLFFPWARAEHKPPCVPVNARLTPRPPMCLSQEDIDAARLRELSIQLEDLEFERANASDETHEAACKALDTWIFDNHDEFKKLGGKL